MYWVHSFRDEKNQQVIEYLLLVPIFHLLDVTQLRGQEPLAMWN